MDFLPWLENWFQLAQGSDWAPEQRRTFLKEAHQIYARRGTRWALTRVLEIYTGVTPEIEDSREDLEPFTFLVHIPTTQQQFKRAEIEALIDANKPAYTTFILEGV
jgi:P2-related tail formation protein